MIGGQMEQSFAVPAQAPARQRFVLHTAAASPSNSFADDVRRGLTATPKFLLPHYFYAAAISIALDRRISSSARVT